MSEENHEHGPCPFRAGEVVAWCKNVPKDWYYTRTPGPMTVISVRWSDGSPTQYAKLFGKDGLEFKPGWIVEIEYNADSTKYYNPPRSLLFGKKMFREEIHEMWLTHAD